MKIGLTSLAGGCDGGNSAQSVLRPKCSQSGRGRKRIAAQLSLQENERADVLIIDNNGSLEETRQQICEALQN